MVQVSKFKFIITIYNNNSHYELCICRLNKRYNKYNFIYEFNIETESIISIDIYKKGSIFYRNNDNNKLYVLTLQKPQRILEPYIFHIMIVGDSGVGKTAIIRNAVDKEFIEQHKRDISYDFYTLNMNINNKMIKVCIWDSPGDDLPEGTQYKRYFKLLIIVYSINSKKSFNNVNNWLESIKQFYFLYNKELPLIYLIGNKVDLEHERKVGINEGAILAAQNNLDLFLEVSSKTGKNIKNIFVHASEILPEKIFKEK